ncbi:mce-like protein [Pseudomonas aeruginosa]|nr:mce-like protein [Pseudomonas aeruginosa]
MSDLPSPKKHKTSNWSAIWVLPLVALAIGAWLAWRAFDQAGVDIQVRFESGDGDPGQQDRGAVQGHLGG